MRTRSQEWAPASMGASAAAFEQPSPATAPAPLKKDWDFLLSRSRPQPQSANLTCPVEVREDLLEATTARPRTDVSLNDLPAGFHDAFVLRQLMKNRKPISGLVVSIGVHSGAATVPPGAASPDTVRALVLSLIGPHDFACQVDTDEFMLIYPNENSVSAQRQLSAIFRRLWDFQLGALGEASNLFSFGGLEVRSESIDEAFASAQETMREAKRSRQDFSSGRILRRTATTSRFSRHWFAE